MISVDKAIQVEVRTLIRVHKGVGIPCAGLAKETQLARSSLRQSYADR